MSLLLRVRETFLVCCLGMASAVLVHGQSYAPQAGEYAVAGTLAGDQVFPQVGFNASGGYVVWEDNRTDGDGFGISAQQLDVTLSGSLNAFRVNEIGAGDQEYPQVSIFKDGGAAFVWQGGPQGFQRIYGRFRSAAKTWLTGDVLINTFTNNTQLEPALTTLTNGDVVVVWSSFNQAGATSMRDVYAQRLSAAGQKLGGEFQINQSFTSYNQRSPSIAALSDGRFVAVWVSEQQRFENSVDLYAKIYTPAGLPAGNEFLINTDTNVCANPSVAPSSDGGFMVAWMQKDVLVETNSWDAFARPFTGSGFGGATRRVNTWVYGDQLGPKISAVGSDYMVVWTSMAQDGSREGVYGQFLRNDGSLAGNEFRVNTTTVSQQIFPAVASDGVSRFLAVWTSFVGGAGSFDLYAQRYSSLTQPLPPLDAPVVSALSSNALALTWAALAGFSVANYEVYADGSIIPAAVVTNNWWTMTSLSPSSAHTFRLAYVLTDGRRSPLSASASGATWGGLNWGGIPYEWMLQNFGTDVFGWPSPNADGDGDGASNLQEFLAGTNPNNAGSVLKQQLRMTPQGLFLSWNTQPGLLYQVQAAANLGSWNNLGGPRFASGTSDSVYVGGGGAGYYRIVRLR